MKAALVSTLAISLWVATFLSAGPAYAAPRERGAADTVALVAKADPTTRPKGRLHIEKGSITAGKIAVKIDNTTPAESVGPNEVVTGLGADYVARPTEGGLQVVAVVDEAADLTQSYQLVGKSLELLPSGWVAVRDDPNGRPVALVAAPWAVDSTGASLPTTFAVKGDVITQTTIAPSGTVFPVVADPKISWGILGADVTYTKSETKTIAGYTGYAATAAAACAFIPGVLTTVACAALMTIWSTMLDKTFNNAAANGKCVKMFVPYTAVLFPTATLSTVKCP